MKTIIVSTVIGIVASVMLVTGVNTDLSFFNEEVKTTEEVYSVENETELTLIALLDFTVDNKEISIKELEVYELEEEVDLGFNPKKYLPIDFNPYNGMNTVDELEIELEIALSAIVSMIEDSEVIAIEDIELIELEEEIELGFDPKTLLPKNFNPYNGMNTVEELEKEEEIALSAIVNMVDDSEVIAIEDIELMEIEEEVELGFDTKKYLPKYFNPFLGMNTAE